MRLTKYFKNSKGNYKVNSKELVAYDIGVGDLEGVPPNLRAAVLAGQIAAYLAGATLEVGATLDDIKAVGAFLSAAGTIAVGSQITFVDGMGHMWEPCGAVMEATEVVGVLAIVSNQNPKTPMFMFPVPVADLLPIYVSDFAAKAIAEDGTEEPCTRQRLTFHVRGAAILCNNLGTKDPNVFSIVQT